MTSSYFPVPTEETKRNESWLGWLDEIEDAPHSSGVYRNQIEGAFIMFCSVGKNLVREVDEAQTAVSDAKHNGLGSSREAAAWLRDAQIAWAEHQTHCDDCANTN